ncbi:MAG: type II toxin-antitoxin system RelE/ParE family toxin [Alphaproteobacteria bacterium]|nr:type II toxin-antitoxin system RelE/ParE family toxin [Alphaproteobacteria bacterium]
MYTVYKTNVFAEWFDALKDQIAKNKIRIRIDRIEIGNLGDHHTIGNGVSELRITYGPGYRLYYVVRGRMIIILLCGGDKGTQTKDIKTAKKLAKEV